MKIIIIGNVECWCIIYLIISYVLYNELQFWNMFETMNLHPPRVFLLALPSSYNLVYAFLKLFMMGWCRELNDL